MSINTENIDKKSRSQVLQVYFCDRSCQALQKEDCGFEASQQRPCIKKERQKNHQAENIEFISFNSNSSKCMLDYIFKNVFFLNCVTVLREINCL